MQSLEQEKTFALSLARDASKILLQHYGKATTVKTKAHAQDIVTQADLAVDTLVRKQLQKTFPEHLLYSEESSRPPLDSPNLWIVDPLDGTRNFRSAMPIYGFLLAYAHRGELLLGVMTFPSLGETYVAVKGRGATLNGKPIRCSQTTELTGSYGVMDAETSPERLSLMQRMVDAKGEGTWSEGFGCGAYGAALVARGVRDYLQLSARGGAWDYAAPTVILQEAGCIVTQPSGKPRPLGETAMLAANPLLHAKLVSLCRK